MALARTSAGCDLSPITVSSAPRAPGLAWEPARRAIAKFW